MRTTCLFCGAPIAPNDIHCGACGNPTTLNDTQTALGLPQESLYNAATIQDVSATLLSKQNPYMQDIPRLLIDTPVRLWQEGSNGGGKGIYKGERFHFQPEIVEHNQKRHRLFFDRIDSIPSITLTNFTFITYIQLQPLLEESEDLSLFYISDNIDYQQGISWEVIRRSDSPWLWLSSGAWNWKNTPSRPPNYHDEWKIPFSSSMPFLLGIVTKHWVVSNEPGECLIYINNELVGRMKLYMPCFSGTLQLKGTSEAYISNTRIWVS